MCVYRQYHAYSLGFFLHVLIFFQRVYRVLVCSPNAFFFLYSNKMFECVSHSHVRYAILCVKRLLLMCDMTHSYV